MPVFNDLEEFCHQCEEFSTGDTKSSLENQRVTEILSHRGDVVPNSSAISAASAAGKKAVRVDENPETATPLPAKKNRAEIEPFEFESAPDYFSIRLYVECANRCGGALIDYGNGLVRRYPCSCIAVAAEFAA
jgi:hypothetical protein